MFFVSLLQLNLNMNRKVSLCLILLLVSCPVRAWWPFTSSSEQETGQDPEKTAKHLENSPVPFEMTSAEEKFLQEAKGFMGDLSPLDACHQIVGDKIDVHKNTCFLMWITQHWLLEQRVLLQYKVQCCTVLWCRCCIIVAVLCTAIVCCCVVSCFVLLCNAGYCWSGKCYSVV